MITNLNDGLVWVVLPVLLVDHGVSVTGVGYIKALYPFMWAVGMIATGHLADRSAASPRSSPGCSSRPPGSPSSPPGSPAPSRPGWPGTSSSAPDLPGLPHPARRGQRRRPPRLAGIRPRRPPVLARLRLRLRRADRRRHRRSRQPRRGGRGGRVPHRRLRHSRLGVHDRNPPQAGAGAGRRAATGVARTAA